MIASISFYEFDCKTTKKFGGCTLSELSDLVNKILLNKKHVQPLKYLLKMPHMSELKTKPTDASVEDFINSIPDEKKRADGMTLLKLFTRVTNQKARMWGTAIVGFDMYHYESERSAQKGDWPLIAFSPRKQNLALYIMPGFADLASYLKKLGKHKISVGCLYINKLADVNMDVLEGIIDHSYKAMKVKYKDSMKK
jgi:hypothetical protein